ncbi:hypothetical protein VNO77_00474 [Canavalia gladiata]|uniref:Uncharacterized protein n=1 Tax=Canavalia gladiata TaxID=3824 RepID=A0AAN9MR76_CANGL
MVIKRERKGKHLKSNPKIPFLKFEELLLSPTYLSSFFVIFSKLQSSASTSTIFVSSFIGNREFNFLEFLFFFLLASVQFLSLLVEPLWFSRIVSAFGLDRINFVCFETEFLSVSALIPFHSEEKSRRETETLKPYLRVADVAPDYSSWCAY